MTTRLIAWSIVVLLVYGAWHYGNALKNPWSLSKFESPVLKALPVAAPGCGEKCK